MWSQVSVQVAKCVWGPAHKAHAGSMHGSNQGVLHMLAGTWTMTGDVYAGHAVVQSCLHLHHCLACVGPHGPVPLCR